MSKLKHELHILRDENQKLRNEVERVRKDYATFRSALVEIVNLSSLSPVINNIARKALFDIGTTGCSAGPIGVLGLTKEEIEESENE
ncbi:hypothetical protein [Lactococcus lactis]|uniref:DUF7982 domain-containing protein n=1 Tax=Lactococcus lactis TaxID=1358 RepID=A0A6M0MBA0_9LACT|nr:hypothetical protein [Lactococcus lactis]NEX51468.1 hypothetical protein [Lactococcus lactis]NEX56804.1 hypothetical protein [Lactococcus lactis]